MVMTMKKRTVISNTRPFRQIRVPVEELNAHDSNVILETNKEMIHLTLRPKISATLF